eukprot:15448423-Heterocapsa_arctica.AAC.1
MPSSEGSAFLLGGQLAPDMSELPELLHPQGNGRVFAWVEFQGHERNKALASGFAPQRMHKERSDFIDVLLTQPHSTGPPSGLGH